MVLLAVAYDNAHTFRGFQREGIAENNAGVLAVKMRGRRMRRYPEYAEKMAHKPTGMVGNLLQTFFRH